ncbi:hypothetical protein [Planctellipticum variicoloris]|uniref:hypothetical protein n=1 Tax=Planctellipticum variicoloris TaxID=3064265 RepID=UPI002CAE310F|nr:hypothetical protein SH412_005562 [Planctomycetaceae bacterium SH412]HTN01075.1 hypothetical protein [Planctomycetaceae bacterium]
MIRIRKSAAVPSPLDGPESPGGRAAQQLADDYDAGQRDFRFRSAIYGAKAVKNALIADQHEKCAFCESKFTATGYGDVEHFRPKGGFTQHVGDPLETPGYYWLAYDWQNLTFSCQLCNQQFKKNHFPLANPTKRARSHRDDLNQEKPLLVNPVVESPTRSIGFRQEVAFGKTRRGRETIEALGLNRGPLLELRRERLRIASNLRSAISLALHRDDLSEDERRELERLTAELQRDLSPDAEFSLMMKTAFG